MNRRFWENLFPGRRGSMAHLSTYFSLEQPTDSHDVKQLKRRAGHPAGRHLRQRQRQPPGGGLRPHRRPAGGHPAEDPVPGIHHPGGGMRKPGGGQGPSPVSVFSWPPPGGRGGTSPPAAVMVRLPAESSVRRGANCSAPPAGNAARRVMSAPYSRPHHAAAGGDVQLHPLEEGVCAGHVPHRPQGSWC